MWKMLAENHFAKPKEHAFHDSILIVGPRT
jgi:hypothetical protein